MAKIKMKTTVKINKGNEKVEVTNFEILERTENRELKNYLLVRESYSDFCNNQTKSGQARKNERARARQRMFEGIDTTYLDKEMLEISKTIKAEKEALIEKVTIEITFDGRKKSNLSKIIDGVKMCYFVGGISPQYYELGLIDAEIK
jgi:hypothetical protein